MKKQHVIAKTRAKASTLLKTAAVSSAIALALIFSACQGGESTVSSESLSVSEQSSEAMENEASETAGTAFGNFSTEDLDGNAANQSVFEKCSLTMVNIWGTFCGPCIKEMPDLGDINREYSDRGFQIIGIPIDVLNMDGEPDSEMIQTAKDIIAETGADYLHILPSADMPDMVLNAAAVPTTFFIDANGNVVGNSEGYLGSRDKDSWTALIDSLLEKAGA